MPSLSSNNSSGGTKSSQTIKIKTLGPRGRSGGSKNGGRGWGSISNVSWNISPKK